MGTSNENKAKLLGMPHGTAANRLRKMILFSLLQKYGENVCFKCGNLIETAQELSIEHKVPWELNGVEYFWNLDNIAFSHIVCNRPSVYRGNSRKRGETQETESWCFGCKKSLPLSSFHKHSGMTKGVMSKCKNCR